MADYNTEEQADEAITGLRDFIDMEGQLVQEAHDLHTKLLALDPVVLHLDELIPLDRVELNELTNAIRDKVVEITDLVESGRLQGLQIIQEEEQVLERLQADVKHRSWRVVKDDVNSEVEGEKRALRLEEAELKELHTLFIDLMKLMKRSQHLTITDSALLKEKREHQRVEEYYFFQIYKFVRAYESIFRHLSEKEHMLAGK
ncbi:MAG TPA: hypothetical protein VJG90_05075 [Candidatus Nanoarchaeia archaeon]|nr:hypothetical protein [Candidatus Nanoarchaeia archaeon]